jgi:hypothetical protein
MLNEATVIMHNLLDAMATKEGIDPIRLGFIEENKGDITILHTQLVLEDLSVSLHDQDLCDLIAAKDEYILNMNDQDYIFKKFYN